MATLHRTITISVTCTACAATLEAVCERTPWLYPMPTLTLVCPSCAQPLRVALPSAPYEVRRSAETPRPR